MRHGASVRETERERERRNTVRPVKFKQKGLCRREVL
jgi:hypothetical protein